MSLPEINELGDKVKHWQSGETSYYRSLPVKNYIFAILSLLGIITTCLPWASVTVGFYNKAIAVGLHFFKGWINFLCFLIVFCIMLFNRHIKVGKMYEEKVPLYGAIVTSSLTLIFLVWKLFQVRIGVYLCLVDSLAFLFFVWYFKKERKQWNNNT